MLSDAKIRLYIYQAQRAIADLGYQIVLKENGGEEPEYLYLKLRYLSAATKVLLSNNGLTLDEKQKLVGCMIKVGNLTNYSSTPFTYRNTTIIIVSSLNIRITDLTDGPMGTLVNQGCKIVKVKCNETGWEWADITLGPQTTWVSPAGDDTCGERGNMLCHFETITAAQTACLSGDTIVVMPGTYSDNQLGKDGITYFFMPGAEIVSDTFIWYINGDDISFKVRGDGKFIADSHVIVINTASFGSEDTIDLDFEGKCFATDTGTIISLLRANRVILKGVFQQNTTLTLDGSAIATSAVVGRVGAIELLDAIIILNDPSYYPIDDSGIGVKNYCVKALSNATTLCPTVLNYINTIQLDSIPLFE